MVTLIVMVGLLVAPYAALASVPSLRGRRSFRGCVGLMLVFCFTGMGHFLRPRELAEMIPPAVPWRVGIIYVTGVVEIAAGVAVLHPRARRVVGWLLIAMLIGLLPFNVYAAMVRAPVGGHAWGPVYLLARVPVQLVLIGWAYWFAARYGGGDGGEGGGGGV